MTPAELRATLTRLQLRQVALARELGVHRVTVARWVAGKVAVPRHVEAWLALYARAQDAPPSRARNHRHGDSRLTVRCHDAAQDGEDRAKPRGSRPRRQRMAAWPVCRS